MFKNFSNFYGSGQGSNLLLPKSAAELGASDQFFALFPHRFDYIYAPHPEPGTSPHWQTERRHPLTDRLLSQSSYLYGVRFGKTTQYCLLDIDAKSAYHPNRDPLAIVKLLAALEPLGLVSFLGCTSSYSGGLHLYFPFPQAQPAWEVGAAVTVVLENAGFTVKSGQLEVFPNRRNYSVAGRLSLFNAHRLPLQMGSYLINRDFEPVWSDRHSFVSQWQVTQARNQLLHSDLRQILKQAQRRHYQVSGKAAKFLNDLNAEIELGWTDYGQTNYLLGRIAMRAYVFNHILEGGAPLEGIALIDQVVRIARSLPGYETWCRHQHEIEKRATEWSRCVELSHYFHYGDSRQQVSIDQLTQRSIDPLDVSWNQKQLQAARNRIQQAIANLLNQNQLPAQATARFKALTRYGIGGGSLYRHKDLWHPEFLVINLEENNLNLERNLERNLEQNLGRSIAELQSSNLQNCNLTSFNLTINLTIDPFNCESDCSEQLDLGLIPTIESRSDESSLNLRSSSGSSLNLAQNTNLIDRYYVCDRLRRSIKPNPFNFDQINQLIDRSVRSTDLNNHVNLNALKNFDLGSLLKIQSRSNGSNSLTDLDQELDQEKELISFQNIQTPDLTQYQLTTTENSLSCSTNLFPPVGSNAFQQTDFSANRLQLLSQAGCNPLIDSSWFDLTQMPELPGDKTNELYLWHFKPP